MKGGGLGVLGEIERAERGEGERLFCLILLFSLKRFFCSNMKKAPYFSKAPILRLYCRQSENVRGVESSRLGVCARLVGQIVPALERSASRRVFPFRRGVVLARRGFFRLRSFLRLERGALNSR